MISIYADLFFKITISTILIFWTLNLNPIWDIISQTSYYNPFIGQLVPISVLSEGNLNNCVELLESGMYIYIYP